MKIEVAVDDDWHSTVSNIPMQNPQNGFSRISLMLAITKNIKIILIIKILKEHENLEGSLFLQKRTNKHSFEKETLTIIEEGSTKYLE